MRRAYPLVLAALSVLFAPATDANARQTCEERMEHATSRFARALERAAKRCTRRRSECPDPALERAILRLRDKAADSIIRRCPLHDVTAILDPIEERVLCEQLARCPIQAGALELRFLPPSREADTAGAAGDVDAGWTGLAHNIMMLGGAGFVADLRDCGGDDTTCDLAGPVGGTFLGAPVPISAGGYPVCLTLRFSADLVGSFDTASGDLAATTPLRGEIFMAGILERPCPFCATSAPGSSASLGDPGTCVGGVRDGEPCVVQGLNDPMFGPAAATSLDCLLPAEQAIVRFDFDVTATTGAVSFPATQDCVSPRGDPGERCWCFGQKQPNGCDDAICTPTAHGGVCLSDPLELFCMIERFRACIDDSHCPAPGDACGAGAYRPCFTDPIERQGTADPPSDNIAHPTLSGTICFPATSAPAINSAAGFPGPGAFELPAELGYTLDGPL